MTHVSDELLSAHIDGEALPSADGAHVETCAECEARLEQLRRVVAVVAAPVAIPAGHMREAAVAAALVETTGAVPAIRRLVPRRDRTVANAGRRMSTASAAAALVVALAVGGWVLSQVGRDGTGSGANTNTALADRDTKSATAADNATNELFSTAPAAGGGASGEFFDAGEIGSFSDVSLIEAKYREYEAQPMRNTVGAAPCPTPDDQLPVWHASLTYKGEPAYARVRWVTPSDQLLEVLRQTDCALLASQALAPSSPR